jgi:diadenosine tetraphosphate (Ap4A) HIT family hydrolase
MPTAVAFPDSFPVTAGHMLVVPRRHVGRLEELSSQEWTELFELARLVCREIAAEPGVGGYNLGVNNGTAAGQTVHHVHVHVIPRRPGDVPDPRGGVRNVIPSRADYWSERGG